MITRPYFDLKVTNKNDGKDKGKGDGKDEN